MKSIPLIRIFGEIVKIMPRYFSFLLIVLISCQPETRDPLSSMLSKQKGVMEEVLQNADEHRLQIIYTQIDRDSLNNPHFTTYTYRHKPEEYFYPASTVKMPAAFLALEKLNEIDNAGLDVEATMLTDSVCCRQSAVTYDSTAANYLPSISHYIRKIFLVSDNDAYNRLYEFLGRDYFNNKLHDKGYDELRLVHRLSIFRTLDENKHTNPIRFVKDDSTIFRQDAVYAQDSISFPEPILLGKGELLGDSVHMRPKDFSQKNFLPLEELHEILKAVIFPDAVNESRRFLLEPDDYALLYKAMYQYPEESDFPDYDPEHYFDSYVKFFMYGDHPDPIPDHIRILNKVGLAYGFLTDVAYVMDTENEVEFLLSATMYANENQILNDGEYEYDEVGLPFMAQLGEMIYEYELERERKYKPNFDRILEAVK